MDLVQTVKRKSKALLPPALFLALTGYFGWNATQGDRGLRSYALREQQLASVKAHLVATQGEAADWSRKVAGLQSAHLDADTVDERARAMLNLADPTDVVVPYEADKKLY